MEDFEYTSDEELRAQRRKQRLALKRKKHKQKQITVLAILVAILVVIIVLVARSCGAEKEPAETEIEEPVVEEPVEVADLPDATATLAAVGDIMMYQEQLDDASQEDGSYDFLPALAQVTDYLSAADITVGNFEASFAGEPYAGYPTFSAPPELATTLAAVGFDILQTANTYSIQNGMSGLTSTIDTIRSANMDALGTYADAQDRAANQVSIQEVDGIKIAFIALTKGLNNMTLPSESSTAVDLLFSDYYTNYSNINTAAITALIDAAKAESPDVIVAMVHWGNEYDTAISTTQSSIADLMINSGVDVILGSHPHVVQSLESRTATVDGKEKEVLIAYSLGNFMSAMSKDYTQESLILNVEFTKDGNTGETTIASYGYEPIYMMDNGEDAADRYTVQSINRAMEVPQTEEMAGNLEAALTNLETNLQ